MLGYLSSFLFVLLLGTNCPKCCGWINLIVAYTILIIWYNAFPQKLDSLVEAATARFNTFGDTLKNLIGW